MGRVLSIPPWVELMLGLKTLRELGRFRVRRLGSKAPTMAKSDGRTLGPGDFVCWWEWSHPHVLEWLEKPAQNG